MSSTSLFSNLSSYLKRIPVWVKVTILLAVNNNYGIGINKTLGPSMQPTINGEFILVNNFIYSVLRKQPIKGEVVLCHPPDSIKVVCKRIHAIEGETVEYEKDGEIVQDVVPKGHVWLLGDHPEASLDSRSYGPVKNTNIRGKVLLTLNDLKPVR